MVVSSRAHAIITLRASPELTTKFASICVTLIPIVNAKVLAESSWNSSFLGLRVEGYDDCIRKSVSRRSLSSSAWGFGLCGRKWLSAEA